MRSEWFKDWFNSPYYHLLYQHRDDAEAHAFIDHLLQHLRPAAGSRILDLACGRGRHSIYLSGKGYDVTGLDLSVENIEFARKFESPQLRFDVHDMRYPYRSEEFDMVLNLFTSFGYFDHDAENQQVVSSIAAMLRPGGTFVIDYLNAGSLSQAAMEMTRTIEGVEFGIRKKTEGKFIIKHIRVKDGSASYDFYEKVQLFSLADFEVFVRNAGLTLGECYGDYSLGKFDPAVSERLIITGKK